MWRNPAESDNCNFFLTYAFAAAIVLIVLLLLLLLLLHWLPWQGAAKAEVEVLSADIPEKLTLSLAMNMCFWSNFFKEQAHRENQTNENVLLFSTVLLQSVHELEAAGDACKAIFWPTPSWSEESLRTLIESPCRDSFNFYAPENLTRVSKSSNSSS